MLFLPAAALCCLCSALVAMAAELSQDQLTLTRRVGQSVSFSCGQTDQCDDNYVYWYQKKETETFRVILGIAKSNGGVYKGFGHPQKDDFSAVNKQNGCELQIQKVKLDHSATYYCSCDKDSPGGGWYFIFGSGTKLFVTDEQVVKPVVSVYPAASRVHLEGRSSLLCLASGMFPPLVRFSWKRQKKNGGLEELPPAEGEQLELRESGRTASIRIVDRDPLHTYKYSCSVEHEGGRVEAQTQQGNQGSVTVFSRDSASCGDAVRESRGAEDGHFSLQLQTFDSFSVSDVSPWLLQRLQKQVKLLCLLYTLLIVKSLVCCCGLSLLMILRNKGASTGCTHAD
ncbi:immunoglobulin lambda-1 light chain-like [Odontesthes bonariensis]|uniref:immunoglobulin lambda-1 light chain-like n=1 Tax=Odontesthes bonariensis TaxID=219752 RepID=UPI003F5884F4